jgi:hypothetical protein
MRSGVISHERATFEWSQYDMGILQRASDILSATVNDFVDRLENPEKMLRQALREMETSIARALEATAKTVASERILRAELEGLTAAIQRVRAKGRSGPGGGWRRPRTPRASSSGALLSGSPCRCAKTSKRRDRPRRS